MNILEWKRNIWICMGKHENHANGLRARTLWIWIHRNEKGDRFENGAESDLFNVFVKYRIYEFASMYVLIDMENC